VFVSTRNSYIPLQHILYHGKLYHPDDFWSTPIRAAPEMADHGWPARRVYGFVCKAEVYGTTEQEDPGVISMKITFHFSRIPDADIVGEGENAGECFQKAVNERMEQFKANQYPSTGGKEIIEQPSLVTPV